MRESHNVVAPLINALHLEGYRNFLPPCYCEDVDEYGGLQCVCRADLPQTCRGDAAATTWIFRGDGSGDAAATTWIFSGGGLRRRRGRYVDIQWRRIAATPRPLRGYSIETDRGDAAAATWIFNRDESLRREYSVETSRTRLRYGTCASRTNCTGGCPWSEEMLKVMGRHDGVAYSIADSFHPVTEEHPSCHLPHVHGDADPDANPGGPSLKDPPLCDGAPCALNVTTVTQAVYLSGSTDDLWRIHLDLPWADTGFLPVSARELKMKLKSRQALWQAAGVLGPDAPLDATDALDRCREINQKAIDWALARASESARRRLNATGKTIATGADAGPFAPRGSFLRGSRRRRGSDADIPWRRAATQNVPVRPRYVRRGAVLDLGSATMGRRRDRRRDPERDLRDGEQERPRALRRGQVDSLRRGHALLQGRLARARAGVDLYG